MVLNMTVGGIKSLMVQAVLMLLVAFSSISSFAASKECQEEVPITASSKPLFTLIYIPLNQEMLDLCQLKDEEAYLESMFKKTIKEHKRYLEAKARKQCSEMAGVLIAGTINDPNNTRIIKCETRNSTEYYSQMIKSIALKDYKCLVNKKSSECGSPCPIDPGVE